MYLNQTFKRKSRILNKKFNSAWKLLLYYNILGFITIQFIGESIEKKSFMLFRFANDFYRSKTAMWCASCSVLSEIIQNLCALYLTCIIFGEFNLLNIKFAHMWIHQFSFIYMAFIDELDLFIIVFPQKSRIIFKALILLNVFVRLFDISRFVLFI